MDQFDGLRLKEHRKCTERSRNQMGRGNSHAHIDYADDLSILYESVSKTEGTFRGFTSSVS